MRGFAGYDFKEGTLTDDQRLIFDAAIEKSVDVVGSGFEWKKRERTYLLAPKDKGISVWGFGPASDLRAQYGTIWGADEKVLLDAVYTAKITDFYPFSVAANEMYMVKDGENYIGALKGMKVKTPKGPGKIYCADEAVCVELDDDSSILHEFDLDEVKFAWEDE